MTNDIELLRRYSAEDSEEAFAELVRKNIDLVYSTALRLVYDDSALAADVTQTVFSDLAQKSAKLGHHTSLTAWLYTTTRFVASKMRRTEARRREREQKVYAMNQLLQSAESSPDWAQLRPLLDGAMERLSPADREAVLFRYFERRSLSEIGECLGLSENAARMRVERALERLRLILAKRGLTSTATALALAIGQGAIQAAPQSLATTIAHTIHIQGRTIIPAASAFPFLFLMSTKTKILIGLFLLLAVISPAIVQLGKNQKVLLYPIHAGLEKGERTLTQQRAGKLREKTNEPKTATNAPVKDDSLLRLILVAADSGKAVPNVEVSYRGWVGDKFKSKKFVATRDGICSVDFSPATTDLELITSVDGFADTRLKWTPKQGATIPATYTVHLTRAVLIGGLVVDYENKPVAGALVGFNHQPDPASAIQLENHEFGWIEVETGPDGRWRINRMAEEILPGIYGSARHPDYVASKMAFVEHDLALLKQFRAQTHVFQLGQGLAVQGLVVDTQGQPIRDAKVRVGRISEGGNREAKTKEDGTFVIAGNKAGPNLVSAEADGFAPATKKIEINETTDLVRIELAPGKRLRLRVVNNEGTGIPNAQIWYSSFERRTQSSADSSIPIQVDFSPRTDGEGRAVWENAPEGNLSFSFEASGFMRRDDVIVHSDDEEHSIKLDKALTLAGTVRDENTGKLIQDFRIICGWPVGAIGSGVKWSTIDRFWLKFSGGVYRHSFEEPVVSGSSKAQFVFKFEADGYTPFQTRVFDANEGDASLDVTLKPGSAPLVTVLSPDGKPVIGADIGLMAPGAGLRLTPGGFSKHSAGGGALLKTDKEGRFRFTLEETIRQVVVASEQGYAAATPESLVADPVIRLLPWGRLEVSCRRGEKAVAGREYTLEFPGERNEEIGFDFQAFKQTGDSAGRLAFGMVPPGKLKLMRLIREDQPGGVTAWGHGDKTDVEIRPGETTQITIGGAGYLVRGRMIFPGTQRPLDWKAFASVHTPYPKPPPAEILQDKEALMAYTSNPEFLELRRSAKNYTVEVHDDGTFISDDIPAGTYLLSLGIVSAGRVAFHSENSLSIPADPVTGVIELGEIPLRPGLEDHP